jgi:hypothetical protein
MVDSKSNGHEMKLIGEGNESKVYVHPSTPDRAIKLTREGNDPETAKYVKTRYYLTKIAHLLFPEMIPDIHVEALRSAQTRTEVSLVKLTPEEERMRTLHALPDRSPEERQEYLDLMKIHEQKIKNDPRVQSFIQDADQMGFIIDAGLINFGYTSEGLPVYLDRITPYIETSRRIVSLLDEEKVRTAISHIQSRETQVFAERLFNRYYQLFHQK